MDSTPNTCADAVWQEKLWRRRERVNGSREQKKLRSTVNSGWLVCAAILDCSHVLLIVTIDSPHNECKTHPTMLCMQCLLRNARLTPQCTVQDSPHNAVHPSNITSLSLSLCIYLSSWSLQSSSKALFTCSGNCTLSDVT